MLTADFSGANILPVFLFFSSLLLLVLFVCPLLEKCPLQCPLPWVCSYGHLLFFFFFLSRQYKHTLTHPILLSHAVKHRRSAVRYLVYFRVFFSYMLVVSGVNGSLEFDGRNDTRFRDCLNEVRLRGGFMVRVCECVFMRQRGKRAEFNTGYI